MEGNKKETSLYDINGMISSFLATWVGILTAVAAMVIIFFVSSIKPDGSIDLQDTLGSWQFWILTGVTAGAALTTAIINYSSTVQKEKATPYFMAAHLGFKEAKDDVKNDLDLLPMYCADKTTAARENEVRNIVEQAGINYKFYLEAEGDLEKLAKITRPLERWQTKTLATIKSIRVVPLTSRAILQEDISTGFLANLFRRWRRRSMLPPSEQKLKRKFMGKTMVSRLISIFLSNLVLALGIVLGNWIAGLANALGVIMALASAIIAATDDARGPIRLRIIARADELLEFKISIPKYRKEVEELVKPKEEPEEKPTVILLPHITPAVTI